MVRLLAKAVLYLSMFMVVNGQESSSSGDILSFLPKPTSAPSVNSPQPSEPSEPLEVPEIPSLSSILTPTLPQEEATLPPTTSPIPIEQVTPQPKVIIDPTTEPPVEIPMTPSPTAESPTEFPITQPVTETHSPMEVPTTQPVTAIPTTELPTVLPTTQPVTELPTNQPPTALPTPQPVTQPPSVQRQEVFVDDSDDDNNNGRTHLRGRRKERKERKRRGKRRRQYMGDPSHFGDGCPPQTVEFVPSPDQETVSVLFSSFNAETSDTRTLDIKRCTITLNFNLESGTAIGVAHVDIRGYAYVPDNDGSMGRIDSYFSQLGQKTIISKRFYDRGFNDAIFENADVTPVVWSSCGGKSTVDIITHLTAKKKRRHSENVQITVDSTDIQQGLRYMILTKDC